MAITIKLTEPSVIKIAIAICYLAVLPWLAIGFWNAIIGLILMISITRSLKLLMPQPLVRATNCDNQAPLEFSTALLVCIRNEVPASVIKNLSIMVSGLIDLNLSKHFHIYILSDTNQVEKITPEANAFESLKQSLQNKIQVTYRRREQNEGFKAGNIQDFCQRWGHLHEFAITLDADSFMSGKAVVRLARIIQADPKLGILQGLVVALPSASAFTRLFQFGMRLGMRSWTMGSAWWQADCGPYWGHNAIFRIKPFYEHCKLPLLKSKQNEPKHILSHDQVEAVLMRRAGYDVRVLPVEDHSFEQNPPTMPEFIQRDLRWCEGNMQYGGLITLPGLKTVSRIQLVLAMLMFIGAPAWIGLMTLSALASLTGGEITTAINASALSALFFATLFMFYLPKLASALVILLTKKQRTGFGGGIKFLVSFVLETIFSLLLCPVMWFSQSMFLLRLTAGQTRGWHAQTRTDHSVPWSQAISQLWGHTLFGVTCSTVLYMTHPEVFAYAMLYMLGLILAIPLCVISSLPCIGRWMMTLGLAQIPEEIDPPLEILELDLHALKGRFNPIHP